jgi:hypothetical protein
VSPQGDVVEGMWTGESAAGCSRYNNVGNNPQFNFTCEKDLDLDVSFLCYFFWGNTSYLCLTYKISLEYYGEVENVGAVIFEVKNSGERITNEYFELEEYDEFMVNFHFPHPLLYFHC